MINAIFEIISSFIEIYLFYAIIGLLFPKEVNPLKLKLYYRVWCYYASFYI